MITPYLLLLGAAPAAIGQSEVLPRSRAASSVAVLALPSSANTMQTTPATRRLVSRITDALRAGGLRVIRSGDPDAAPLEELTGTANIANVDVALSVWNLAGSPLCAAVLAPPLVSPPSESATFKVPGDEAGLARHMSALTASLRSKASRRLAAMLSSSGTWCDRPPTESEAYLLAGLQAPTVVISVSTQDEATLTERLPTVIDEWLAAERN